MVKYECFRCGYTSTHKPNFINHLKRKNICPAKNDEISIENMLKFYKLNSIPFDSKSIPFDSKTVPKNSAKTVPFDSKSIPFDSISVPFDSILTQKKTIQCKYCLKCYSTNSNLTKHLKLCKLKKENDEDKRKIFELEKNKLELTEKVDKLLSEKNNNANTINNNTTNNIINHNTTNNNNNSKNIFIVNNYGNENKDYITHDYLLKLLKKPFQAIPELIKFTHFNKEHPENQNIKIPNKKQPYVKILKNDKWELADRKNTISDLIDQKHSELNDSDLSDLINNKFKECELNRIERFNEKYMNDDKDFVSQLYKDTELIIINNS